MPGTWIRRKTLAILAGAMLAGGFAVAGEALTPNGQRLGDALGVAAAGNETALNSQAGGVYADMLGASISVQREFRRALPSIYSYSQTAHYQNRADAGVATTDALAELDAGNYAVVCPTTMCSPGSNWVMWDVPFLTFENRDAESGFYGYDQRVSGFATGISRMLGEASAIGLAVGYDARELSDANGYHVKNRADTFHASIFGGTNIGNFFIDGYAGYSYSRNRAERDTFANATTFLSTNKANFADSVLSAGLKVSYVWILPSDMRVTPSIGIDFSHVSAGEFTERNNEGVDNLLASDRNSYSSASVPLMVSVNKTFRSQFLAFKGNDSLWTPEVRAGFVPEIGSERAEAGLRYAGNAVKYAAQSSKLADAYGTVGGGLKIKLADKFIFGIDYDYTFGAEYANHSLTGMYGVSF